MASITLREAREQFVASLKNQKRASATVLAYGKDVDQLVEFVATQHKYDPSLVSDQDIENFKIFLKNGKYTSKSISRKINSIKSFFRFLKNQNLVAENPAARISHPKYDIAPPRVLTKIEYRALRDAAREDVRMSSIIELLLQTGMRIGELANIQVEDVDLKKKALYIRPFESREGHNVPLSEPAVKAIENYLVIRPRAESKTLFLTKTGNPFLIRNIRTAVDRYFKMAGVDNAKVNDLRHTFIMHQLQSGASITLIQKLVGHKRLSTTEKYLKLIDEHIPREESVKLEEL